jgi:hypothetical protein
MLSKSNKQSDNSKISNPKITPTMNQSQMHQLQRTIGNRAVSQLSQKWFANNISHISGGSNMVIQCAFRGDPVKHCYIDEETGDEYDSLGSWGEYQILQRRRDGFQLRMNSSTLEPMNETAETRNVRLNIYEAASVPLLLEDDVGTASSQTKEKDADTKKKPRSRKYHDLSEGESESEDPDITWRSLRKNENVGRSGLRPPEGHDPSITASAHITSGSKAKVKSAWVSTSRSVKVAGSWASESDNRVAKLKIPESKREARGMDGSRDVYDITAEDQSKEVFPTGKGSSLNTAKASQEVVIKGGVGPEDILALYEARKITVGQYKIIKAQLEKGETVFIDGRKVYTVFRSRTETALILAFC